MAAGTSPTTSPATKTKSVAGIALTIVGLVIILLVGGYVIYRKYIVHAAFRIFVFHPLVYSVEILGLVVLIVGIYFLVTDR
jgi:hypothetical protein